MFTRWVTDRYFSQRLVNGEFEFAQNGDVQKGSNEFRSLYIGVYLL